MHPVQFVIFMILAVTLGIALLGVVVDVMDI